MTETRELIRDHASLAEVRAGRAPSPELTVELSALLEVRGGWSYHHAARIAAFLGFSTGETAKLFRAALGVRHDATGYLEILAAHFRPKPRKAPAKPVDKEAVAIRKRGRGGYLSTVNAPDIIADLPAGAVKSLRGEAGRVRERDLVSGTGVGLNETAARPSRHFGA